MVGRRTIRIIVACIAMVCAGPVAALSAGAPAHHTERRARRAPHHGRGAIPQHNGGDRDADNNGGPNDGDGSF